MSRKRQQYEGPGSFGRLVEAGIALADADTSDDKAWHAAEMRLRQAENARAPRVLGAKGGRARAQRMTPEQRSELARALNRARWSKRVRTATEEPETKPEG